MSSGSSSSFFIRCPPSVMSQPPQQAVPSAPDSPALVVTSNVQKYAIKKKKVLSAEESELFELTQAAGITVDQEVFKWVQCNWVHLLNYCLQSCSLRCCSIIQVEAIITLGIKTWRSVHWLITINNWTGGRCLDGTFRISLFLQITFKNSLLSTCFCFMFFYSFTCIYEHIFGVVCAL